VALESVVVKVSLRVDVVALLAAAVSLPCPASLRAVVPVPAVLVST
jgi:hypothetical protein